MRRLLLLVACAVCLALRVDGKVQADPTPQTPICGLDGFKLDTLDQADYWSLIIEPANCIIPTGYSETNIDSCLIYFSICKSLPESICPGHTNSSTCEVVITDDGNRTVYSIGDFQNIDEFTVIGGPDTVGFTTVRQGDIIESRLCNSSYSTALTWACDSLHRWDPQNTDATPFITSIVGRSIDDCFLEVEFGYTGACYETPTLSPNDCQLETYDLVELSSNEYWFATVDPVLCYGDEATSCTFYFSFCQAVPPLVDEACYEAGVCQTGTDGDGNKFGYNMGTFNPQFTRFYENVDENTVGFHMDVQNGSQPDDGRCNNAHGIKTRVLLACNSSVKWTTNDLTGLIQVAYLEEAEPCEYVILVQYAGACKIGPTNPTAVEVIVNYVGWIFIGIFFFVVVVYLAVGAGFQFIVRGERGLKAIPNYEFWALFFMSVLGGCKFFLDIVTCFQFDGQIKTPGKSNVDYDKI